METTQNILAYDIFLEIQAEKTGKTAAELRAEFPPEEFIKHLGVLYNQWQSGEISFGKFTELINVPHWELREILEALSLQLHN
jgi:hypothetical protein